MKKILGFVMLIAPFVGIFSLMAIDQGFLFALGMYGAIAFLFVWIVVAVYLFRD